MDLWNIINEFDENDFIKIAEKLNDKWNDLKILPNEELKKFFSKVDSLVS